MATSPLQVQGTNDNSTLSKVSTAQRGYFDDSFIKYFVSKVTPNGRAPLIHWGYWIRYMAIDTLLRRYLCTVKGESQIISLGAGFDASYFRLKSSIEPRDQLQHCHYYEVDYPTVITRKEFIIQSTPALKEHVTNNYTLIGCDITYLNHLEASLIAAGVNRDNPTLLLAEVVLTYISPQYVDKLLVWAAKFFPKAILCVYEQFHPFDGFGQVMLKHFRSLSSPLVNIEKFPTTSAQCQRYINAGWSKVYSCDMNEFYNSLPNAQTDYIKHLEPFDEYEEWHLKCSHYHLICALTSPDYWMPLVTAPLLHTPSTITIATQVRDTVLVKPDNSFDSSLLKRYGHDSVLLSDGQVLIYGGFGVKGSSQAHGRLDNLVLLKTSSSPGITWEPQEIMSNCLPGALMYHSMTVLPSAKEVVLLIGGRTSPKQPNHTPFLLTLDDDRSHWKWNSINYRGDQLEGRWRHSTTLIDDRYAVIVGGCTVNGCVFDDIIVCDTKEWIMKKLPVSLPMGIHSHLALKYQSNILLVYGGLNSDLVPLNTCMQIEKKCDDDWSVQTLEFTPSLPARYSMSGHIINTHTLVIVGGVSTDKFTPEILIINLQYKTWTGLCLKYPVGMALPLPCGHTSHQITQSKGQEKGKDCDIICFGGGGNCFSFGTHFNAIPFTFII